MSRIISAILIIGTVFTLAVPFVGFAQTCTDDSDCDYPEEVCDAFLGLCGPNPDYDGEGDPGRPGEGDPGRPGEGDPGRPGEGDGGRLLNPLTFDSVEEFFVEFIRLLVRVGFIIVTVAIMIVGFMFVTAQGNEEKLRKAREALLWTLVGAVILLGAEAIALVIQTTIENIQSST